MKRRSYSLFSALIIIFVVGSGSLATYRIVTGRSLGISSLVGNIPRAAVSTVKSLAGHSTVVADSKGEYTNIVFLHHSVGENLINEGGIREQLTEAGYSFYDHGYNQSGLTGPDGTPLGYSYNVPGDNTDPEGLSALFQQKVYSLPFNTLSGLLQHEVIIIKSCYTGSQIPSDEQLEQDKASYLEIRESMAVHPDKLFIILTSPPLNPAETNREEASRANELAEWLASPEFVAGYVNIFVFDLFGFLVEDTVVAVDENMLKVEYRLDADSHPNLEANVAIGPVLVQFIRESVEGF